MSSAGLYDVNLLHTAPDASHAQKQEGYNVDLLTPNQRTELHRDREDGVLSTSNHEGDIAAQREKAAFAPMRRSPQDDHTKRPFWRTRTGKIVLFLLAVVIIGAIVGGTVGGVVGGRHSKTSTNDTSGMGSDGSGSDQGSDTNQGTSPQSSSRAGQAAAATARPTARI